MKTIGTSSPPWRSVVLTPCFLPALRPIPNLLRFGLPYEVVMSESTRVGMEGSPVNGFHSATRVPNLPLALEIPFLIISRAS